MKEGYLPKDQRKKILFISDDMFMFSGVATMSRSIVEGTSHYYNWVQIGAGLNHPHAGNRVDVSKQINELSGNEDSSVVIYPASGYGDPSMLRQIMKVEKPDAILIFTDPRYFVWLFQMENEIRKQCPLIYYTIWDELPVPIYNKPYYESCDGLLAISKQTENINKLVLGELSKDKIIKYVPHGINNKEFFPIEDDELLSSAKKSFFNKEPKFVAFFNSRNIRRKSVPDLLAAWKLFQDNISPEQQQDTALLLHTDAIDENGTDLLAVRELLFGKNSNVHFTNGKLDTPSMNVLYNISDVTILPSSNEGWGLSVTESLMSGTMIIASVTGGIQDQFRFEDEKGDWIKFDKDFPSNHFGTFKKCGKWAKPVFPNNMSLLGSISTPYIWDSRIDFKELAKSIEEVYNLEKNVIKENGLAGREWVLSDESGMSSLNMCKNIMNGIDETITNWNPRKSFELIKIKKMEDKKMLHPLLY